MAQVAKPRSASAPRDLSHVEVTGFGLRAAFANSVLHSRGFFSNNSTTRESLAQTPLPLLTWPFLDFLATLDLHQVDLVELGAGSSTLVFGGMFRSVRSFENDRAWLDVLQPLVGRNVALNYFAGDLPDATIVSVKPANWLLVDFAGRRTRFIRQLLRGTMPRKLPTAIILDNSDWYRNGARLLARAGYTELPFFGFKSGQTWISCTSLFFLPKRCHFKQRAPFQLAPFARARPAAWDKP